MCVALYFSAQGKKATLPAVLPSSRSVCGAQPAEGAGGSVGHAAAMLHQSVGGSDMQLPVLAFVHSTTQSPAACCPADPSLRFSHAVRSRQLSEAAAAAAHRPASPAGADMTRPPGPAQLQHGPAAAHAGREAGAEGAALPGGSLTRAPQGSIALLADRPPSPPEALQVAAQLSTAAAFFASEGASPTHAQQAGRRQEPAATSSQRVQLAGRDQQGPGAAPGQGVEQAMQGPQHSAASNQTLSPLSTQQAEQELRAPAVASVQGVSPAHAQQAGQKQPASAAGVEQQARPALTQESGQQQQPSPVEYRQSDSHARAAAAAPPCGAQSDSQPCYCTAAAAATGSF